MQKIAIIGLDRLGTSVGLAIRKWIDTPSTGREGFEVVGFDYEVGRQRAAEKVNAVHRTQWSLGKAVQDAVVVILNVSGNEQRAVMQELVPLLPDEAILTDTSPHKQQSLAWATELLPKQVSFVAGHPIVPSGGDQPPSVELIAGCTYALFPHLGASQEAAEVVVGLVQAMGAKPYFSDPAEHDAQIAATTFLPALAATAMMHTVSYGPGWRDLRGYATGDLAELTRLASLDPKQMAEWMSLSPADAGRWLDTYIARLGELRDLVRRDDQEATESLEQFFSDAYNARERWLRPTADERTGNPERAGMSDHITRLLLGRRRRPKS